MVGRSVGRATSSGHRRRSTVDRVCGDRGDIARRDARPAGESCNASRCASRRIASRRVATVFAKSNISSETLRSRSLARPPSRPPARPRASQPSVPTRQLARRTGSKAALRPVKRFLECRDPVQLLFLLLLLLLVLLLLLLLLCCHRCCCRCYCPSLVAADAAALGPGAHTDRSYHTLHSRRPAKWLLPSLYSRLLRLTTPSRIPAGVLKFHLPPPLPPPMLPNIQRRTAQPAMAPPPPRRFHHHHYHHHHHRDNHHHHHHQFSRLRPPPQLQPFPDRQTQRSLSYYASVARRWLRLATDCSLQLQIYEILSIDSPPIRRPYLTAVESLFFSRSFSIGEDVRAGAERNTPRSGELHIQPIA